MTSERETDAPSLTWKITNFVIFQVVYAACVLGAARGHVWLGPLAGLGLLPINLWFVASGRRWSEVRLWLWAGAIGFVVDSCLLSAGVFTFPDLTRIAPEAALSSYLVPPWIVTLWVAVGTMLRSSLTWLRGRYVLAAALGLVGGPFSFWSGSRLDATVLPLGFGSLAALGLEYAALMPTLLRLADSSQSELGPDVTPSTPEG